ncbi:crossover junction endodeoxyribonuclease RuvC [Patescibacteria group bacterium]|nr:crossover junction endodeoxyribonuclease RuvC [Patescibacteria group bacterium]
MTIMGIDPGLATTGWGILEKKGQKLALIDYGLIATNAKKEFAQRLKIINQDLAKVIKKYKPDAFGVESIYFCKNVKTALLVGQARGVILLTCIKTNKPIFDFTPLQIKQAITTYGRADKKQVQQMVKIILNLKNIPKPDHAADALACAICAANSI